LKLIFWVTNLFLKIILIVSWIPFTMTKLNSWASSFTPISLVLNL
jgi:hypothetical protein